MEILGKTAVVMGAGSGIGRGLARVLSKAGMNLVLVGHHRPPLEETASSLMGDSIIVKADVSNLEDVQHVAEETIHAFGAAHLLCNNAGVGPFAATQETTIEEWEWVLSVNLWGVIHGLHVFLPLFEAQNEGHIHATASESGLYGVPFLAAYNTSKFAVVGLMQSLERDLRATGSSVTSSVLCPGATNTHLVDGERPVAAQRDVPVSEKTDAFQEEVARVVEDGMDPETVAECVLEGIRKKQFWHFSHDQVPQTALKQAEVMSASCKLSQL
ncbi:SDR family NAD(P)-dependent oxidoreductase [Ruegeria hyattellae]|uniref:SDR family NAD(P)-dependent oxidoreductase n=1 Tax=Ruegeria hyattellae TaxID=3233337 RepID=UPI00355AF128